MARPPEGNSGTTPSPNIVKSTEFFAAFDALPRSLRDLLDTAPYLANPLEITALLQSGIGEIALTRALTGAFRNMLRIEAERIYGPTHPHVTHETETVAIFAKPGRKRRRH